ncbi:TPA: hypothetical protein N0F65_002464 [Lagenidium giganteum]|uniref:Uncharacterized protein n=1 Tax=Lagenidium giganteum TaxID=4803 RepID=A0AAV2YR36_9STRA|nr:TPA: hypothetical protein N0F65_002464 [Lagenidium giganteum]
MPPRLQTLEYLIYLEIFNSTIKQWNASAAVVSTHQPRLANIVLVLVSNITSLPVGLTQPQMPAYAVEICGSDLEKLPVDIASKWSPRLDVLYIERSQLSTFPRAVLDFSVIANVSLALNNVSVLPRELFAMNSTSFLTLSGNPITAIPDDCAAPSHVAMLDVRNTSISSLTRCVGSAFIDGAGSPLCVNGGVGTINESKQQLSCGNGGREMTMFPLAELVVARAP